MTTTLNLTKAEQDHLTSMDEKFRREFGEQPAYSRLMTIEAYINMRRIDEGLATLQPDCLTTNEPDANTWLASELGKADPILAGNPADVLE